MKYIFFGLLIFSLICPLFSKIDSGAGEYGFQILKIPVSTSNAALAEAGTFSSTDGLTFLSNPTAGVLSNKRTITFSQNNWIFDTSLSTIGISTSNGKKSFGFSYRYLDYGKMDARDDQGNITGNFKPRDFIISTNFGLRITPDHYAGITTNLLYEKIHTNSSVGFSTDIGYTYLAPIRDLKLAFTLKNLGFTSTMDKESIDLAITEELSLSDVIEFSNFKLIPELKFIYHQDDDNIKTVLGLDTQILELLSLRLGYKDNYDNQEFTYGFGLKVKNFRVDYSYLPFTGEIDTVHMFGLSYNY